MFVHPLSSVDYLQMYTYRCTTTHLSGLPTTVHMFVQPLTTVDYLQLYMFVHSHTSVEYIQLYICLCIHSVQWITYNCTYACTTTHYSGLSPTVHMLVQPLTTVDYLQLYICLYSHSLQWIISNCTYVCTFTHFSGLSSTLHKVRITTYFGGLSPPVYKHLKIQSGSYIICANSLTNIFLVKG